MTTPAKVSIIIPAYNAAATISRCVESVQRQSFDNWELIIVDDGSSDRTSEVCKWYTVNDNRITYINQPNGGVSKARNTGIDAAKGEYISFLDADDTYDMDFLRNMLIAVEAVGADMGICGFYIEDKGLKTKVCQPIGERIIDTPEALREYLRIFFHGNPGGIASLWNKIYLRDKIERLGLRLDTNKKHGEDWKFNLQLLCGEPIKIVGIDTPLYNYIKQPNSLSTHFTVNNINQIFESAQLMLDINHKFNLNEEASVMADLIKGYVGVLKNIYSRGAMDRHQLDNLIDSLHTHPLMKAASARVKDLPISLKFKILYLLHRVRIVGPWIFRQLCKLK